jgi:REP element-mobilizing transposase RayT
MKELELSLRTWGGRRRGAGRPPKAGRWSVPHRRRAPHVARCPAHVTLRAVSKLPSLRDERTFVAIRRALGQATKAGFRVFEFSVQTDHLHLLVEANDPTQFERGMRGLTIRIAKTVNRVLGRAGRVWGDRFHARLIRTPREMRNAPVYVLQNWRKHLPAARGLDAKSSAAWFSGWRTPVDARGRSPLARARTWLATLGWRRHGRLLDVDEAPRHPRVPSPVGYLPAGGGSESRRSGSPSLAKR